MSFVFLSGLSPNKGISGTFQVVQHALWSKIETKILALSLIICITLGKLPKFL